jgi:hypothetical protein
MTPRTCPSSTTATTGECCSAMTAATSIKVASGATIGLLTRLRGRNCVEGISSWTVRPRRLSHNASASLSLKTDASVLLDLLRQREPQHLRAGKDEQR